MLTSDDVETWSRGYELSSRVLTLVEDALGRAALALPGFDKFGNLNVAKGSIYRLAYGNPNSIGLSIAPAKGRPDGPRVGCMAHRKSNSTSAQLKALGRGVNAWEFDSAWGWEWIILKRPLREVLHGDQSHEEEVEQLVGLLAEAQAEFKRIGYWAEL